MVQSNVYESFGAASNRLSYRSQRAQTEMPHLRII
jgi:hypothetical protein